jgi:hypothetical protein
VLLPAEQVIKVLAIDRQPRLVLEPLRERVLADR